MAEGPQETGETEALSQVKPPTARGLAPPLGLHKARTTDQFREGRHLFPQSAGRWRKAPFPLSLTPADTPTHQWSKTLQENTWIVLPGKVS